MLKIEQFEGDLYLITVQSEDVDFSGIFKLIDGIPSDSLIPAENGLHLTVE